MKNNKNRDFSYLKRINEHFDRLFDLWNKTDEKTFLNDTIERSAILFDLLQIGELTSHLSNELQLSIEKEELDGVISIRNHIVHGYSELKNDIIINCLNGELAAFVHKLNENSLKIYRKSIKELIGKTITILVDEPVKQDNKFNKGHINEMSAPDHQLQKVYIIDTDVPLYQCKGTVVGYIEGNSDSLILLAAVVDKQLSEKDIKELLKDNGI